MALVYCNPWQPLYPKAPFWGANGHFGWNNTKYATTNMAQQAADLTAIGFGTYRNGYSANYDTSGNVTSSSGAGALTFISTYPAIQYVPVLLPLYISSYTSTATAGTYATAYTIGFNLGVDCATNLKGKVPWYEVGNEYDGSYWPTANGWDNAYMVAGSGYGNTTSFYNNAKYLVCLGSVLGMWDGIRSVDAFTPIATPATTWVHQGFLQNLWNGTTPSAPSTVDSTKIRKFDKCCLHMYVGNNANSDNFEAIVGQGVTHSGNYFLSVKDIIGNTPIIITEYGVNSYNTSTGAVLYSGGETDVVAALTTSNLLMDKFYNQRLTYGIEAVIMYQLMDAYSNQPYPVDPNSFATPQRYTVQNELGFGVYNQDGTTQKTRAASIASFIAAHPV